MQLETIHIGLAFLEGFALIISPCILPVLPIILAGSVEGDKSRPYGIIIGFVILFSLFTFFSRALVQSSGIDLNLIRNISFGLLLLLGIMMLSTYLTEKFNVLTQRLVNVGANSAISRKQEGLINGIIFGGLIGIIWTPCAGPILAAVIVQTVLQKSNFGGFLTIMAFGIGAGVPMLIIALFGRRIMSKFNFFRTHGVLMRKILGAIIIVTVVYLMFGGAATSNPLSTPASNSSAVYTKEQPVLLKALASPYPAPPIEGITAWINSKPLQLSELKGKVVLIDIWAYSCINCLRALPHIISWYQKYHNKGLVVIGIHAPEFEFEQNIDNVKKAVKKLGIPYPVALDNLFKTWQNYNNSYWPASYLIDKNGNVVFQHFGEGEYDVTENNIRVLLGIKKPLTEKKEEPSISFAQTPETYLGFARMENFKSPESAKKNKTAQYSYPKTLSRDDWALRGSWMISQQRIMSASANAAIKIHFHAGKVFAVMGVSAAQAVKVKLLLNGELVIDNKGKDVKDSMINVSQHRLYRLIEFKAPNDGILELTATAPGLEVYTFTFGD